MVATRGSFIFAAFVGAWHTNREMDRPGAVAAAPVAQVDC